MVISLTTSRSNQNLDNTEFLIVKNLKRAIVETHNGNYNEAEARIGEALDWMYLINTGDK